MVSLRKLRSTAAWAPGAHPLPTPALSDAIPEIQP